MGVDEGVNLGVRHWFAPGIPTIGANRESTGGAGLGWGDPCSPVSWRGLFEDPWWDPFGEGAGWSGGRGAVGARLGLRMVEARAGGWGGGADMGLGSLTTPPSM